jgi:hypothetical protein
MPYSPMPLPSSIDREAFLVALAARFPDIAGNISDIESGLLHPEMGVVSDATRVAIAARDWETVAAHFQFISEVFAGGNDAVRNAVYVSYLENVLLGESSSEFAEARSILPPLLSHAMLELEEHFEELSHANPRP